jgi:GTPase
LAINKWDLVPQDYRQKVFKYIKKQIEKALGSVKALPIHYISAKTGFKVDDLMDEVLKVYERWNVRVSTGINHSLLIMNKIIENVD